MDPHRFIGLDAVADAVEWLQSGRSFGKVYVQIPEALPPGVGVGGPGGIAKL